MRFVLLFTLVTTSLFRAVAGAPQDGDSPKTLPQDSRLSKHRDIYDKLHPWSPPKSLNEWKVERQRIRERLLVSNGLWPMPEKTELNVRLGKVFERDGYSVQHAMFRSRPGHYVTGLLYRPTKVDGKAPAVLCPHGHWADGRFYDAGEKKAKEQLANKAESIPEAARSPLQARFVQLARMGCIVFHYDMVGYADSTDIVHRKEFNDANALLWLTNKMGLQTWNSIRAVDFLLSFAEVDPNRIGVTGSSGGGTQSFMLAALDPRPVVAFPAVMVSTNMQGGCNCENASYMRIGINNVAIASLFAPRPMAMSGADDWTIDIEKLGLPELRQVYSFYDKPTLVNAKCWPEFKHNYNSVARHMMYEWFNEHLKLGIDGPIKERGFTPLSREELSVYGSIKKPDDVKTADQLRQVMRQESHDQLDALLTIGNTKAYRNVVEPAARVMFNITEKLGTLEPGEQTNDAVPVFTAVNKLEDGSVHRVRYTFSEGGGEKRNVILWIDGEGLDVVSKTKEYNELNRKLARNGRTLLVADYFGHTKSTRDLAAIRGEINTDYAGLTYCYNPPLLSERVGDIVALLRSMARINGTVSIVGTGKAGPIALLAAATSGVELKRVVVDLNGFSFANIKSTSDEMMLPGAMRYGDIGGLAALVMPAKLSIHGTEGISEEALRPLMRTAEITKGDISVQAAPLKRSEIAKALD